MENITLDFVVCIDNSGYAASLQRRKLYRVVPDADARKHNQIRVIDASGEDYLYSASLFPSPWAQGKDLTCRTYSRI